MKRLSLIIALAAVALCGNAQLLWKVTGNGLKSPSYLFGTHHIAPVSIIESTPGFPEALAEASTIYGEVEMKAMTDPAIQMKVMQLSMAPADSTLSKVISAEGLSTIDRLLSDASVPATSAMLEPLKPAAVSNTIAMILSQKAFPDFNPATQLDLTIQQMATEQGKTVKGLETIDSQLNLLFGGSIADQAESLSKTLADVDRSVALAQQMASAYMSGNLMELNRLMNDPESGMTKEEADKLINSRNNAWLEILLGVLPTASVLVVVGAGHLPGDEGLIEGLRKAGYTVEPAK